MAESITAKKEEIDKSKVDWDLVTDFKEALEDLKKGRFTEL